MYKSIKEISSQSQDNLQSLNTKNTDLIFSEDSFMLLENILMEAGELDDYVPYQDLVDTKFASEVAK